jgi:hypothetical protein
MFHYCNEILAVVWRRITISYSQRLTNRSASKGETNCSRLTDQLNCKATVYQLMVPTFYLVLYIVYRSWINCCLLLTNSLVSLWERKSFTRSLSLPCLVPWSTERRGRAAQKYWVRAMSSGSGNENWSSYVIWIANFHYCHLLCSNAT